MTDSDAIREREKRENEPHIQLRADNKRLHAALEGIQLEAIRRSQAWAVVLTRDALADGAQLDSTWMAHLDAARVILKNQGRNGWEDRIYVALQQIMAGNGTLG